MLAPAGERARLAQRLISSLDREVDADAEKFWLEEAERPLGELKSGQVGWTRPVEAFRQLPVDEQARLVEELWDELARELEQRPLNHAERRLLDERIRQHQETPTDVEAWETARDDILRDL